MVDWQSRNTVGKQTAAHQEPKDEGTKVARKIRDNSARRLQCHFSISSSKEQVTKVSGDQRLPVKSRTRRHLDTTEVPSGAATRRVNWVVRKWQAHRVRYSGVANALKESSASSLVGQPVKVLRDGMRGCMDTWIRGTHKGGVEEEEEDPGQSVPCSGLIISPSNMLK
ncbi:GD14855 [Drosophila simulans]|uniref:GD14855 n=1 Tax=Drosophila simulans TaxID=7240 RepID=B4QRG8_DROSI|nr:GD14855 [Drosophila simulans]